MRAALVGTCLLVLGACTGDDTDTDVDTDTDTDDTDIVLPDAAPLFINELMADNETAYAVGESFPDWIELYNAGDEPVDLLGWTISDDPDELDKHTFIDALTVPAGGFLVLLADESLELGAEHIDFKLSAGGEELHLTDPWGRQIDAVEWGEQQVDYSVARVLDGDEASGWAHVHLGTPGATNAGE